MNASLFRVPGNHKIESSERKMLYDFSGMILILRSRRFAEVKHGRTGSWNARYIALWMDEKACDDLWSDNRMQWNSKCTDNEFRAMGMFFVECLSYTVDPDNENAQVRE